MDNIPPEGTGRINHFPGPEKPGEKPFARKPVVYKDKKVIETAASISGKEPGHFLEGRKIAERKGKGMPGQTILNPSGDKEAGSLGEHSVEKLNDIAHALMDGIRGSQKNRMFSSASEGVEHLLEALDNKDEADVVQGGLAEVKLPEGIHVEIIRNGQAVSIIPPANSLKDGTVKELRFYCILCLKVIHQESGNDPRRAVDHLRDLRDIEQARAKLQDIHNQIVEKAGKSDISGQLEKLDSEPCSHSVDLKKEEIEQLVPEIYRDIATDCIVKLEAHARKNTSTSKPDPRPERRMPRQEKERLNQQRKREPEVRLPVGPSTGKVTSAKPESLGESEKKRELEVRVEALEAENLRLKKLATVNQSLSAELESLGADRQKLSELNREQQEHIKDLIITQQRLMEENRQLKEVRQKNRESINALESSLKEQEHANHQLREQNQRLIQSGEAASGSNTELERKLVELEQTNHLLNNERSQLRESNQVLSEKHRLLLSEIKRLESEAQTSSKQLQQLQAKYDRLSQRPSLESDRGSAGELARLNRDRDQLKQENHKLIESNQLMVARNNTLQDAARRQQGKERANAEKIRQLEEAKATLENRLKTVAEKKGGQSSERTEALASEVQALREESARMKQQNVNLETEKQEILTRLSEMMGTQLSENNPNIADLSDEKRPTKIAEMYNELYDNEWTDAFDELCEDFDKNEKKTIATLRQVMAEANILADDLIHERRDHIARNMGYGAFSNMPKDVGKTIKDLLKKTYASGAPLNEVVNIIIDKLKKNNHNSPVDKIRAYAERVAQVSIFMAVQDPPVVIKSDENPGIDFDKSIYREYTKTGKKMDYIVWPPLFLHKDGPLLAKGVAQGKD